MGFSIGDLFVIEKAVPAFWAAAAPRHAGDDLDISALHNGGNSQAPGLECSLRN